MHRLGLVAILLSALALTACDGESDGAGDPPQSAPTGLAVGAVSCPDVDVDARDVVDFRGTPGSPKLVGDLTVNDLGGRDFCAQGYVDETTPEAVSSRITAYTVRAADDRADYGETYTTSDRTGSDELLNFPFGFHVNGPCRDVTATIVVTDAQGARHRYVARTAAGPGCDGG